MALKRINKELLELEKEYAMNLEKKPKKTRDLFPFSVHQPIAVQDPSMTICFIISLSKYMTSND